MKEFWSEDRLADLFDMQIKILRRSGHLKEKRYRIEEDPVMLALTGQKDEVIKKASIMRFENEHSPFLPVVTYFLDIHKLMSMVINENGAGYTYVDPQEITDMFEPPDSYYIYNVEDGSAMRNRKPEEAKKLIEEQGRRGLTGFELISLGVHKNILLSHNVYGLGSYYYGVPSVMPVLWLYNKGDGRPIPKLSCLEIGFASKKWGAPSCDDDREDAKKQKIKVRDKRDERIHGSRLFFSLI